MPRSLSKRPIDAAATPLPTPETTPPVTKMYLGTGGASRELHSGLLVYQRDDPYPHAGSTSSAAADRRRAPAVSREPAGGARGDSGGAAAGQVRSFGDAARARTDEGGPVDGPPGRTA